MKNIPNYLSFIRIILSTILFIFFDKATPAFMIIFCVAMLTDLLDGFLARKLNVCSNFGAFLDSIADFILDPCIVKLIFTTGVMKKSFTVWLCVAIGIGTLSPFINYLKHKKVFFIHSILCKLCMWLLFCIPFAITMGIIEPYLILTLSFISLSMLELLVMSLLLDIPDPNAKSIYSIIKGKKTIKT